MDKFKEYLAVNVLNESKVVRQPAFTTYDHAPNNLQVDYRLLSRAIKVHVNLAKQMLFEFHRSQNARKPGSVRAIYYLRGSKAQLRPQTNGVNSHDGQDSIMQSSPFMSSTQDVEQVEHIIQKSGVVVQEQNLSGVQEQFEIIDAIYVYALAPGPLNDLSVLSECSRKVATEFSTEDPLVAWKTYGVIQNPSVRRRTGKRPPPAIPPPTTSAPSKAATKAATVKKQLQRPEPSESAARSGVTEGTAVRAAAGAHAAPVSDLSTSKPELPTLKREKSDIFKSFAKTKPKAKQESQATEQPDDGTKPLSLLSDIAANMVRTDVIRG